jgi:type I restriction enzyme S subunit
MVQYSTGTTMPSLNEGIIERIPIVVPLLAEQHAIANILGAFDDKIHLNRVMNRTVEGMARALFRSWFVDFDPVVAKAAGGEPFGLSPEVAALFPTAFQESELGPLPSGWKVARLGDVVDINTRSIGKDYLHRTIRYVDISSVSAGRLESTKVHELTAAPSRARRIVRDGDTIWSCVRPNLRAYCYINAPPENLVVSTGFAVVTPRDVPPTFVYEFVTTDSFADYLSANAEGSAYPAVRPDVFARAEVILPSKSILDAFERVVRPLRTRVAQNDDESHKLSALRDALLPQLLSGEVRLSQGGKLVEQVF